MAFEGNVQKNKQVATAIALAGRSCRPCDVCGRDQARWFCSADEAYLCGKCDQSVHGANAVASRHERVALGPRGLPCLRPLSASASATFGKSHRSKKRNAAGLSICTLLGAPKKKPRSIRPHPHAAATATAPVGLLAEGASKDQTVAVALVVKNEPASPGRATLITCDELSAATVDFFQSEAVHEVPIFAPGPEDFLLPCETYNCSFTVDTVSSRCDAETELLQQERVDSQLDLNCFLSSKVELRAMKEEVDVTMDEFTVMDELGLFTLCGEHLTNEEYRLDFPGMAAFCTESTDGSEGGAGDACEAADESLNDMCWKVKEEKDDSNETEKLELEVDELLACALVSGHKEEEKESAGRKISLKLDYEDVLMAWSDRGSLWTDGRRPHVIPEECEYDSARYCLGIGIVPDISYCIGASTGVEQVGLVPVANVCENNGGREARVMRYREKRRTRLFSKKIRYEVRKLNAKMRPRWKGRFVKRSAGVL